MAESGDRVFMVGYGSGAGSDGFDLTVTKEIDTIRGPAIPTIHSMVQAGVNLDYATYAKFRGKIRMAVPAGG